MNDLVMVRIREANDFLAGPHSQAAKQQVCVLLEAYLMAIDRYHGFTYNYWTKRGYHEWRAKGRPEGEAKQVFLYGPEGVVGQDDPDFVSRDQGEFSRHYFGVRDD